MKAALSPQSEAGAHTVGGEVRARGYGYRYTGRAAWSISDLTFTVQPGERVLLAGPSGIGKSTLLHGVAGVLGEDEGESVGSLTVGGIPSSSDLVRGRVGLVQQDPESQRVMERVGDEVAFGLENTGVSRTQIWPRVKRALHAAGLNVSLDRPTARLSGGEKQRLALASAFAMEPTVLLLDEPTANLDPAAARQVVDATVSLINQTDATLLVVDHNLPQWLPHVDRLIVLGPSGLLADGPPQQVLAAQRDALEQAGVWLPDHYDDQPASSVSGLRTRGSPDTEGAVIALDDATLGYTANHPVAEGVFLGFKAGEATFITGPSGIGKSTLALALAGLMAPLTGQVQATVGGDEDVVGIDPNRWKTEQLLGRISMVFQEPQYQFLTSKVAEELALGPRLSGWQEEKINREVSRYLKQLHLTHLADAHPLTLSGGEKRRLAVGTALISAPEVLVLDEPTFGQDRRTWQALVALLSQARADGVTLIVITHDQHLVAALAQRVIPFEKVTQPAREEDRSGREGRRGSGGMRGSEGRKVPPISKRGDTPVTRRRGLLERVNPAVQLLALVILTVPLLLSIDPVSALIALALEIILLPLAGLTPKQILLRVTPLLVAAPLAGISMLLYGKIGGDIFWQWGPIVVSENSVTLAASLSLRVLAVGLPAVIMLPSLGATPLADSLIQVLKLPSRFVIASLAGVRMVGLMMADWQALGRARRSRGVSGHHFFRSMFQLLAFSLRRAELLTVSMEARGFGSDIPRTNARVSTLGRPDAVMLIIAAVIPAAALGAALLTGTFTWFGLR